MKPLHVIIALLFGSVLASSGCASGFRTPEAVLEEQLRTFHGHMRWGRMAEASGFVSDDHREVFLGIHEELGRNFEVTEYEIESVVVDRKDDTAVVQVWMQWFRLPSTRVNEATYREIWVYSTSARAWQLTERERQD